MDVEAQKSHEVIIATNLELQKLLSKTVEVVALNHALATSSDPNVAIVEVLDNFKTELKSAVKPFAADKLFTDTIKRDTLLLSIDISTLDSSLLLCILLKVKEFLNIATSHGTCNQSHPTKCCNNCDHYSATCKKCISGAGNPARNCKLSHPCLNCANNISKLECGKYAEICCGKCGYCVICSKKFAVAYMNAFVSNTVSPFHHPCPFYLLQYCLEISLNWRNLIAHLAFPDLINFVDGKTVLKDFPLCKNKEELFSYIRNCCLEIMYYMNDLNNFINPLKDKECKDFEESFECILRFGKPLQRYLGENYHEIKRMYENSGEAKMIEFFQLQMDDLRKRVDDKDKDEPKSFKMSLKFSITRQKVGWVYWNIFGKSRLRDRKALSVGGKFRKIVEKSWIKILKESLNLQLNRDFYVKKVDCLFLKKIDEQSKQSGMKFEMEILTEDLGYSISKDIMRHSEEYCENIKSAIEDGIRLKYNLDTVVLISCWELGSIIIIADIITLENGDEITKLQQNIILEDIKIITSHCVDHENISVKKLPTTAYDHKVVTFCIDIVPKSWDVKKKVHQNLRLIEVLLIEKIKISCGNRYLWQFNDDEDVSDIQQVIDFDIQQRINFYNRSIEELGRAISLVGDSLKLETDIERSIGELVGRDIPSSLLLRDLLSNHEVLSRVTNRLLSDGDLKRLYEKLIEVKALPVKTFEEYNHEVVTSAFRFLAAVSTQRGGPSWKQGKDELTLEDFRATAEFFSRDDIVQYLETVEKTLLKELSVTQLIKLSVLLGDDVALGERNWKHFAFHYGYNRHEINNFGEGIEIPNHATEFLLLHVLEIKPRFTLKEFIKCLETIKRYEVVTIVEEFEKKANEDEAKKFRLRRILVCAFDYLMKIFALYTTLFWESGRKQINF